MYSCGAGEHARPVLLGRRRHHVRHEARIAQDLGDGRLAVLVLHHRADATLRRKRHELARNVRAELDQREGLVTQRSRRLRRELDVHARGERIAGRLVDLAAFLGAFDGAQDVADRLRAGAAETGRVNARDAALRAVHAIAHRAGVVVLRHRRAFAAEGAHVGLGQVDQRVLFIGAGEVTAALQGALAPQGNQPE